MIFSSNLEETSTRNFFTYYLLYSRYELVQLCSCLKNIRVLISNKLMLLLSMTTHLYKVMFVFCHRLKSLSQTIYTFDSHFNVLLTNGFEIIMENKRLNEIEPQKCYVLEIN